MHSAVIHIVQNLPRISRHVLFSHNLLVTTAGVLKIVGQRKTVKKATTRKRIGL